MFSYSKKYNDPPYTFMFCDIQILIIANGNKIWGEIYMAEKFGVGLWVFGLILDRFVSTGYKPQQSLQEKIKQVSGVNKIKGVEIFFPTDFNEEQVDYVKGLVSKNNLEIATICVDLYSDPRWQNGSFSSKDLKLREEAVTITKKAVEISRRLDVNNCSLWLGQDGFDYMFHDYERHWDSLCESIRDIANHGKNVTIFLEYKPKEPRTHLHLANLGKTLYLISDVGLPNVGVVLDTGHGMMADEDLGETVFLLARRNIPFTMHFNDNYGYWDDDMIVGSINFWKYVELFYYLKKCGYNGWYDIDIYPYREDPKKAVGQCVDFMAYMKKMVNKHYDKIDKLVQKEDVHLAIDALRKTFLKE